MTPRKSEIEFYCSLFLFRGLARARACERERYRERKREREKERKRERERKSKKIGFFPGIILAFFDMREREGEREALGKTLKREEKK